MARFRGFQVLIKTFKSHYDVARLNSIYITRNERVDENVVISNLEKLVLVTDTKGRLGQD